MSEKSPKKFVNNSNNLNSGIRIQKALSKIGVGSRREIERAWGQAPKK